MQIKYMKNLEKFLREQKMLGLYGVDEKIISDFEAEQNISFPQAYKEYLYLTGNSFRALRDDHEFDYILEEKSYLRFPNQLKKYGIDLKKEYWVFANEGGVNILFFYLDEGDNPPVYTCEMQYKGKNPDYLRKLDDTFSEYLQFYIDNFDWIVYG